MELMSFTPLYMERVWGGRGLELKLGRTLPGGKMIGESWELVDREDEQSVVAVGTHKGKTIRELLEKHAVDILGPGGEGSRPFPILIKWLDCQERLSLQVHPPAGIAPLLGGEPKTENWYIADCDEDASLIVGLKQGVTREQFTQALKNNKVAACVHRFPVKAGDSILVESGRVPGAQTLADCKEFRIRKFKLKPEDDALELPAGKGARLIHAVEGRVTDKLSGTKLAKGSNYLQPYVTGASLRAEEPATLLITDKF